MKKPDFDSGHQHYNHTWLPKVWEQRRFVRGPHQIDRPRKHWSDERLQKYMVFCLLLPNTSYNYAVRAYDAIMDNFSEGSGKWNRIGHETRLTLPEFFDWVQSVGGRGYTAGLLKEAGYPDHKNRARWLVHWAKSPYSNPRWLREAKRNEIVRQLSRLAMKTGNYGCKFEPQLAAMYTRTTRTAPQ